MPPPRMPMRLSGQNEPTRQTEEIAVFKTMVVAVAAILMLCAVSQGDDLKKKTSVVIAIDKESLLKELKPALASAHVAIGRAGWSVGSMKPKRGVILECAIAVCESAEKARALYRYQERHIAVMPEQRQGQSGVGNACIIGLSWAFFVRDNVFVLISWKNTFNQPMLERMDKHLMEGSGFVTRGQFDEVPRLGDLPEKEVVIAAGQAKEFPVTWHGLGKASPAMWVSSPNNMSNRVANGTVHLKVLPGVKAGRRSVRVCAVGEGLVFAMATVDVVCQPAATTQPASTRPAPSTTQPAQSGLAASGKSGVTPADAPNPKPKADKKPR